MEPKNQAGIQVSEHEWFFPETCIVYNDETSTLSVPESVPQDTVDDDNN